MRRVLVLLSLTIILLVAAAHVYRDPRVQDLFRSAPRAASTKKTIAHPVTRPSNDRRPRPEASPAPPATEKSRPPLQDTDAVSRRANQTPNETVGRVLLQILAAKGLSRGISLEVSDESVGIFGEVDSDEKRKMILSLIDKGRESRRLDATGLTVQH